MPGGPFPLQNETTWLIAGSMETEIYFKHQHIANTWKLHMTVRSPENPTKRLGK